MRDERCCSWLKGKQELAIEAAIEAAAAAATEGRSREMENSGSMQKFCAKRKTNFFSLSRLPLISPGFR